MNFKGVIFDLDGTVYRGKEAIPGAADFIHHLRDRAIPIRFVTNRANRPAGDVCQQLTGMGLDCTPADVLTSADATAAYLKPGRVYAIGESGLIEALDRHGFIRDDQSPDYVIVSFDREFNFKKLSTAVRLISNGAQFVATNPDRALRLEHGISPGTGSLVAAVQAATVVVHAPMPQVNDPRSSSVDPSQSSSSALHASPPGVTSPVQGPQTPAVQVSVPDRQAPTPSVPAAPE